MDGATPAPTIPDRPRLKPWYRVSDDGERLLLEYAHWLVVFEGKAARRLLPALLPLLDGSRTVAEIVSELGDRAAEPVENALRLLAEKRLLTDGPPLPPTTPRPVLETVELLAASGESAASPAQAHERLHAASVAVAGASEAAGELERLLGCSGVGTVARTAWDGAIPNTDLFVLAPSGEELPGLEERNRALLAARRPWLQMLPYDGRLAAAGPLYLPDETSCYECFRLRIASNLGYADEYRALERRPAPFASPPAVAAVVAGIAATLALRWLVHGDRFVPARFFAVELTPVLSVTLHHVYRVPRCPACSDLAGLADPLPWFKESLGAAR